MTLFRVTRSTIRGVRILKFGPNVIQNASITGRNSRGGPLVLPKPFPYEKRRFTPLDDWLDNTMFKYSQENARVIVVEGPIGVGKTAVCKALAEEFDMLYMPSVNMDLRYVLPSGYDLRQHDDELPERIRTYDHKNFCVDPTNVRAARFQMYMFYLKFFQYLDALCHLLNTGQGIILERSHFSDFVFMKAMHECGFLSKEVAKCYNAVRKNVCPVLMPPHLIVYLDISVPVVQERIRTRNFSYEQNSPALTDKYLKCLEKYWKEEYLLSARKYADVLIYDWSDGGDVDVLVDDIEGLNLDIMRRDMKFVEWWLSRKLLYVRRLDYTNKRASFDSYFRYPYYKVDDLYVPEVIALEWDKLLSRLPECQYDFGYNYKMGDSIFKILLNSFKEKHRHARFHLGFMEFFE